MRIARGTFAFAGDRVLLEFWELAIQSRKEAELEYYYSHICCAEDAEAPIIVQGTYRSSTSNGRAYGLRMANQISCRICRHAHELGFCVNDITIILIIDLILGILFLAASKDRGKWMADGSAMLRGSTR